MKEELFLSHEEFTEQYRYYRENHTLRMSKTQRVSFTVVEKKLKIICEEACRSFVNPFTNELELMLPGQAVKLHLNYYYDKIDVNKNQKKLRNRAPEYYIGKILNKPLVYIDIVSCYYQIYRHLWLDIMFPCGAGKQSLGLIADKLKDWKSARNSLVGFTYSNSFVLIRPKCLPRDIKPKHTINVNNYYYNPALWYTVNYFLHELANIALHCGAVYIATDGYIFPTISKHKEFINTLSYLGLDYKTINGVGSILGWQSYRIYGYDRYNKNVSKTTLPSISNEFENPIEIISEMSIREKVRKFGLKRDNVNKLNLTNIDKSRIISWWLKINRKDSE